MKQFILCFVMLLILSAASAQIPNADFDIWDTAGTYITPDGWDNMDNMTTGVRIYTCEKGAMGSEGHPYLMLTTRNTGSGSSSIIPGMATAGLLNKSNENHPAPQSGFPYSDRPAYLSGQWQYMASGTDQGYISVKMTKWDSINMIRTTVGTAMYKLPDMVMLWEPFNIPITYTDSISHPDSAMIVLSASNILTPAAGSYLYVEDLVFSNTVLTGINEPKIATDITIYPNPATDNLTVDVTTVAKDILSIQLMDMTGRIICDIPGSEAVSYKINTRNLAAGAYIVGMHTTSGSIVKPIILQ